MCWESKTRPEIRVADRDIPIFKVCSAIDGCFNRVSSYYFGFGYELDVEYRAESHNNIGVLEYRRSCGYYIISVGFHSYGMDVTSEVAESFRGKRMNLYCDHLSSVPIDSYLWTDKIVRVDGFIPKGSMYALDERGEYVSDCIVLTEIKEIDLN